MNEILQDIGLLSKLGLSIVLESPSYTKCWKHEEIWYLCYGYDSIFAVTLTLDNICQLIRRCFLQKPRRGISLWVDIYQKSSIPINR